MTTKLFGVAVGMLIAAVLLVPVQRAFAAIPEEGAATVEALADELLAHLRAQSAYVRLQSGLPIATLDPITFERAQEEAQFNRRMLERLDAISIAPLPHEQQLLAQLLHHTFRRGAHADEVYWFDFAVTPYAGAKNIEHAILAAQPLQTPADRDNYLRLLDSYALMLAQAADKTRAQAQRGIRVAQPAIPGVIAMFRGLGASTSSTLVPAPTRLAGVPNAQAAAFMDAVQKRVAGQIQPGYEAVINIFDDAYTRSAPRDVGISRYLGGKEIYLQLIADYTAVELTPRQIHDLGRRRVLEIEERMQAVRDQLGFKGSREAFEQVLHQDPRFLARSPAELEQRYLSYVARMEPFIPKYFSVLPKARYGVRRLAPASEKGMTYGYYIKATPANPVGYYYYNGSQLEQRSLIEAQHTIYHELIPGHHLQLALQQENNDVHPVREFLLYGAFAEGWAEYAASLGEELGLYDPYDLYGHLAMQAFFAARLVLDTGMNYLDMSLEQARAYMKAHTSSSDVQVDSELLRYSTDYYAQALGYRLGYEKFWALRRRAEKALGKSFDIRDFHSAAIGAGALPLDVLDKHIDWFISQRQH